MKQYQGGHDETWGGVTINIDRNYLDLGKGSVAEPRDATATASRSSFTDATRARRRAPTRPTKVHGPAVPAQGAAAATTARLTATYDADDRSRAVHAWQDRARPRRAPDSWSAQGLDRRCWPTGRHAGR